MKYDANELLLAAEVRNRAVALQREQARNMTGEDASKFLEQPINAQVLDVLAELKAVAAVIREAQANYCSGPMKYQAA